MRKRNLAVLSAAMVTILTACSPATVQGVADAVKSQTSKLGNSSPSTSPISNPLSNQTDALDPLGRFKILVSKFEAVVKNNSPYVAKFINPQNPNIPFFWINKMLLTKPISYDVKKTDSLVSPFTAVMGVTFKRRSNGSCGDKKQLVDTSYDSYSNLKSAIENKDNESCFVYDTSSEIDINYLFSYQNDKWILKDVLLISVSDLKGKPFEPTRTASEANVFGLTTPSSAPITEPEAISINKVWKDALEQ